MNRNFQRSWLSAAGVMLLGLILLFSPDSASRLVSTLLGWGLMVAGGLCVAYLVLNRPISIGAGVYALLFLVLGGWLLRNPLALAAGLGRVAGLLLAVRGFQALAEARRWDNSPLLPAIQLVLGVVLLLLPMTASRLVFRLVGVVLLVLGVLMLMDDHRGNRLDSGDPDIIDV